MAIHLAATDLRADCEAVLRSLPRWFGIEDALQAYVQATQRWPTLVWRADHQDPASPVQGFVTLQPHFAQAWEMHCLAVHAQHRGQGAGRALVMAAEAFVQAQGGRLLQVKTLGASHPSPEYALTRAFYLHLGYWPLEEHATLWGPRSPCLQLVKPLPGPVA